MLSAQPPADSNTRHEAPPTAGKSRYRRRVKSLAQPVEPEVVNPLRLIWPRANSRKNARVASRYGFVGFLLALAWVLVGVPAETINQAVNFSSAATGVAVIIGAVAVVALVAAGYFYHSAFAALLALAGVITLVVLDHQSNVVPALQTAGQVVIIYLLLHGVHGTIAYHIFGRRKRHKRSDYRYKRY